MNKSLVFLTLSGLCIWIILDNFYGKKYLAKLIHNILNPDSQNINTVAGQVSSGLKTVVELEKYNKYGN